MRRLTPLILCALLLTGCNDEQGPQAKKWNGGKPVHVPDSVPALVLMLPLLLTLRRKDRG